MVEPTRSRRTTIQFTQDELEAVAGACETMMYQVNGRQAWQNEPPETLAALRNATKKILAECYVLWSTR